MKTPLHLHKITLPAGGSGAAIDLGPLTAWLASTGNDGTGTCGDPSKPYATIQAAYDDGARTFILMPKAAGNYGDLSINTGTEIISLIGTRKDQCIIDEIITPDNAISTLTIYGSGRETIKINTITFASSIETNDVTIGTAVTPTIFATNNVSLYFKLNGTTVEGNITSNLNSASVQKNAPSLQFRRQSICGGTITLNGARGDDGTGGTPGTGDSGTNGANGGAAELQLEEESYCYAVSMTGGRGGNGGPADGDGNGGNGGTGGGLSILIRNSKTSTLTTTGGEGGSGGEAPGTGVAGNGGNGGHAANIVVFYGEHGAIMNAGGGGGQRGFTAGGGTDGTDGYGGFGGNLSHVDSYAPDSHVMTGGSSPSGLTPGDGGVIQLLAGSYIGPYNLPSGDGGIGTNGTIYMKLSEAGAQGPEVGSISGIGYINAGVFVP